jgi:ribosome recycling factor
MMDEILLEAEEKMEAALSHLASELQSLRTGRANVHLLDHIKVIYYGTETPLNQLATIGAPEATLLTITPFDPNSLRDIEKAILASNLGLTPGNDGRIIRLPIPPLTQERRIEMAKQVSRMAEETKTAVRNVRRHANDRLKAIEKEHQITEDQLHDAIEDTQKLTDDYSKKIDTIADKKKSEIMNI